jgi:hypothetical protein
MGRRPAGSPGTDSLGELARVWVETTCAAQGVPVKIDDRNVLVSVGTLLGLRPQALGTPDRIEAGRVEPVEASPSRVDDDVVENGGDNGVLAA